MTASLLVCLLTIGIEPTVEIDFATEIVPVLTKAGCNAGACHGAAAGRGGFRLSLLGGDAAADYESIVQAFEGRRVNLHKPAESLLLKKPTGYLDHGGDVALPEVSVGAARVLAWITAGAPRGKSRQLTHFEVTPVRHIANRLQEPIRLIATARFDDGPPVDVTQWTIFTPADAAAMEVVEVDGQVKAKQMRRGQQVIIARFLNRVLPVQFIVPLADMPTDLSQEREINFIDREILATLATLRIPPAPPASDAAFLRRVRLDLTGRLPDVAEVHEYIADRSADKRTTLIERLLASDEFADYWTLRFARQLRLHSLPNEKEAVTAYAKWIRTQLATNRPFNEWAADLLTATGDSHIVGPANFGRMVNDARGQAELAGEFFLGVRLGCANCHNHPLDCWTQDDYHGLAAVFARLERGRHVAQSGRGAVTNLRTGEPATPRIPGVRDLPASGDSLAAVASWLSSSDNKAFARATVNRLWQAMFGRGLIDPVDDLRETNPATHPELLDRIASDFVQHGYDLKHTLRQIALSSTYARSSETNPANAADDRFYSHALRRPLGPEVLADAVADVAGVPNEFAGQTAGVRAVALVDPLIPAPALDLLGRCSRAGGCSDATAGGGLPAQLHLLNGDFINRKLVDKRGRLQRLLDSEGTDEELVADFFLRGFGRKPTNAELERWRSKLKVDDPNARAQACEDFVWALLNSREFAENH